MNLLKQHNLLTGIIIIYFLLRLPNLTTQPLFADEAIYIHWAQIIGNDINRLFYPMSDGKTPLFMWLMVPLLKIVPDPLFAGRLLSVFSGLATVIGAYILSMQFFNKKTAVWSALLITTTPFILFFDRMALVDSLLAACTIWVIYLGLRLVKKPSWPKSIVLGVILGVSVLTKTPGIVNFYLLPFLLITVPVIKQWKKTAGFLFIAGGVGGIIYNLLRFSQYFNQLAQRDKDYQFPLSKFFQTPLDPLSAHFQKILEWYPQFLTWPVLAAVIAGIGMFLIKKNRIGFILLLWSFIPFFAELILIKALTTRYLLFTLPPLLIVAAWTIDRLCSKLELKYKVVWLIPVLLLIPAFYSNFLIVHQPQNAPIPRESKRGYFEDWTAGYGLKDIANYLKSEARKGKIYVFTEEAFGTLPDGLIIYLQDEQNITTMVLPQNNKEMLYQWANQYPTFLVANKFRFSNLQNLTLIKEYPKLKGPEFEQDAQLLFKVKPQ